MNTFSKKTQNEIIELLREMSRRPGHSFEIITITYLKKDPEIQVEWIAFFDKMVSEGYLEKTSQFQYVLTNLGMDVLINVN